MAIRKMIGEVLSDLGFVTRTQLEQALGRQREILETKVLPERLRRSRLVAESRQASLSTAIPMLGELLKEMGFVSQAQLDTALETQKDMVQQVGSLESEALFRVMDMGVMVNMSLNLAEVLNLIMKNANQVTGSEASTLMLVEEETAELIFSVPTGPKEDQITDVRIRRGQGIAGWVAEHEQPVIIPDVSSDSRFFDGIDKLSGFKTKSVLAVPLKTKSKLIGVLEAVNKKDGSRFTEQDALLLTIFGTQAAMAIENARLYGELKTQFEEKGRMERNLSESEKLRALGQLSGGIAHDFNNILGAIIGYAEIALYKPEDQAQAIKSLKGVLAASERARDLVGQILAFSRQSAPEKVPVRIDRVVTEALELLRSTLPVSIRIDTDIDPEAGAVFADPTQIHQVLINLFTNAWHAIGDREGAIRVSLEAVTIEGGRTGGDGQPRPGAYVKLEVADDGCGMEECILDQIFDPYFSTKEKGMGTGMGLAVVHGIVKNHGGSIRVASHPGGGTRFSVWFPRIKGEIVPEIKAPSILPTGTERILLVDDEKALVEIQTLMLSDLGYRVTPRTHPEEALALFREDPDAFDLLLTDMTMPKMSGSELAQKILEIRPDFPIVLITGYSERINRDKALALGIRDLVFKPLNTAALSGIVRQALANDYGK
jgi:signal transduction histidine kinase/ActR/RegA family two-component response regulator